MVIGREMTLTGRSLEYQTTLNSLVRYIKLIYLEIFSPYMALILVIVHVGDIKKSSDDCVNFFYNNTATELKKSSSTVFIIPGDNDWIECDNTTHGIALWENSFVTFHKNWENITTDLPIVSTQSMHPENFSFIHKDVIFIGINLINNVSDEIVNSGCPGFDASRLERISKSTPPASLVSAGINASSSAREL